LKRNLLDRNRPIADRIPVRQWIYEPGLPAGAALPKSDVLDEVRAQAGRWRQGELATGDIRTRGWSTQEWQQFLVYFENHPLEVRRMADLDGRFHFTRSGNSEVTFEWLLLAVRYGYRAADARLEAFLVTVGRQKFVKPLYEELLKAPGGRRRAEAIFARAKPGYHPITASAVADVLSKQQP